MRYTARVPFGNVAWDTRIPGGGDLGFRVAGGGDLGLRVGMLGGNPRMAREIGAPRGRRVGSGPKCPSRTTIQDGGSSGQKAQVTRDETSKLSQGTGEVCRAKMWNLTCENKNTIVFSSNIITK